MALKDVFKKKSASRLEEKKPQKKLEPKAEVKKPEIKMPKTKKTTKTSSVAWKVLESPHVTEKASDLTAKNEYVFKVTKRSNKIEIAKAVEDLYGVKVDTVRVINVRPKKRRMGRTIGTKKGYKKAIVKLHKGQEIEVLPR
jgi:large subunit ribosomal protein L23